MAEALAEFFGDVAAGKVPVSTKPDSLYQQFKDFIKDILAALGWDMRSIDLSKPTDVRAVRRADEEGIRQGYCYRGVRATRQATKRRRWRYRMTPTASWMGGTPASTKP
jgi:hypothetical protein